MDSADVLRMTVPVIVAGIAVSAVLYFWPRAPKVFLSKERKRVKIVDVTELSHDVKRFRLSLGSKSTILGLPVGKHMVVYGPNPKSCLASGKWNGREDQDKGNPEIDRKYTPITGNETPGYVDLVIKVYKPGLVKMPNGNETTWTDGGKGSLFFDSKKAGDEIEINGPIGVNEYLGRGIFKFPGRTVTVKDIGMMAGGTGLTPMLQVAQAALRDSGDTCTLSLLYANKTVDDILCREILDDLAMKSQGRFKVYYTVDFPPPNWNGKTGFITQDMIKECLPAPSDDTVVLMCGPPPMVEFACKKNLESLGYDKKAMVNF